MLLIHLYLPYLLENIKVETNYKIKLSNDSIIQCRIFYRDVPISIGGTIFPGDLIEFNLSKFDIILGMDWLHTYEANIDCKNLKFILGNEKCQEVHLYG